MDNKKGKYEKYNVTRIDGKPVKDAIVIEVKDPQFHEIVVALASIYSSTRTKFATDIIRMCDTSKGLSIANWMSFKGVIFRSKKLVPH